MWTPKRFRRQEFVPLMQFLIDMYAPDTYVEIGVQKAWTFNQISPLVKTAIAVDIAPMPKIAKRDNVEVRQQSSFDFSLVE